MLTQKGWWRFYRALGKSLEWGYTLFKFTFPMEKQRRQVKQVFDKFEASVTEQSITCTPWQS